MLNYQKHAHQWDKYEQQVQRFFEHKDIIQFGSKLNADKIL